MEGKQYHDIAGGYQRLDIFDLRIDRSRKPAISILTPMAILIDRERMASGSATTFTPDDGGGSSEGFGARRPSAPPWPRLQIKQTSLNHEDAANRKETRTGSLPTGYGEIDDSLDLRQLLQNKKKQEAASDRPMEHQDKDEKPPMKTRYVLTDPMEHQDKDEKPPMKRRYFFRTDGKD